MKQMLAKITVKGRVHGVWFRAFTRNIARELKLNGWVKNQSDGTVYTEVTGSRPQIGKLIHYLTVGPELSQVDDVSVKWEKPDHLEKGFYIQY
ncbi:MAG: acylphosphatase [Candidatus Marinimicrobia bacterium]|nr:acylphosphatase [Candidatus Neomarinimicrobiota bacterium]MBL7059434.1 acylphosphatase [Candidatus Neomarinimicrobiota bacterium]